MPTRNTYYPARAGFIADHSSIVRVPGGRQIDWANVNVSYQNAQGKKVLPAGTVVGDLLSAGSGKVSPRVLTTNPAKFILETEAVEDSPSDALSGYGMIEGGSIYENLLPDATGGPPRVLDAAVKSELGAQGMGWSWHIYVDTRS